MGIILVHGGAGTLFKGKISEEREARARAGLTQALKQGILKINQGESAVNAVVAAVSVLEDCEVFNAGKGSVYTHEGYQEMDAALMAGHNLEAGAVARVQKIKNPIQLAQAVLEHSPHVLLTGSGAEAFADIHHVPAANSSYFASDYRWQQLLKIRDSSATALDHALGGHAASEQNASEQPGSSFGTVGAVALDQYGNLAAATSTGGMTNKRYGRIGDSPIIGHGTYADKTCAVSATGHGEYMMRTNLAYDVAARMKYLEVSLAEATAGAMQTLANIQGGGGLIALDAEGNWQMPFNTGRMYRGFSNSKGEEGIWVYT